MAIKRRQCAKCRVNRQEKFFKSARARVCSTCQRKRVRVASRSVRLVETYNITEAEYADILRSQGGVCAICKGKRNYNLDVDHDHALEKLGVPIRECIRGLLCKTCNRRLLPSVHDSIDFLYSAIDYLRSEGAKVREVLS